MKAAEKAELKRQGILEAAQVLVLDHGYGGMTMDSVAELAKVTKQTVYRYFPSKSALFAALIARPGAAGEEVMGFLFGDDSLSVELTRYGEAFLAHHMQAEHLAFFRVMLLEAREDAELADIFAHQAQPAWLDRLTDYLAPHCDRLGGAMSSGTAAHLFNTLLLSERTAILMGRRGPMERDEIARHVAEVVRLFLGGFGRNA